jgi:3-dehydrosphinganine reductase
MQAAAADPSKQRFHYISADLTNPEDADRILDEATKWNNGVAPDTVWCCAGYCHPGYFIDVPIQTLREQMDTVYWTAAYTAHATLRRWLKPVTVGETEVASSPRHIIFTASTLSFFTVTGYGPYSPPKAAMRNLSDVLVQEIEMYNGARRAKDANAPATDVKIHIVFPMGISSPGFENEQKLKPDLTHIMEEADKPQQPDEVAAIAIKGLERGDFQIITNTIGQLMRTSSLGASPRNNFFFDTASSWLINIACLFIIPDLTGKAFKFGKKNGIPATKP